MKTMTDSKTHESGCEDSSVAPRVSYNHLEEDEKFKKAKEKLALFKKKPLPSPKNGLRRTALLPCPPPHPHPGTQDVNSFLADWGVAGSEYGDRNTHHRVEGGRCNNGWGKRSAGEDWVERNAKKFGGETAYQASDRRTLLGHGDDSVGGHQGAWNGGVRHNVGANHVMIDSRGGKEDSGSGMSVERMWMEKFLVMWRKLLESQWSILRAEADREVQDKKQSLLENQDLGSKFNEPALNQRVVDKMLGEERAVFKSWESHGMMQLECTVCNIIVSGVKTMQGHMQGKKHLKRLEGYEVLGIVYTSVLIIRKTTI